MSNQLATVEQTVEQPPRLPALAAGNRIQAIVPNDFESAWRIANAVCKAGMAPKGLDTSEKAMVAIMHGLEVGLTPMAALQSIAIVNGRPSIWGDGAIGLVRGSGLLEWIEEKIEGDGDKAKAVCTVQRRGEPKPVSATFSVADARAAGLWGKQGPWSQYPKRMLQMRARGFCLRDAFADVLRGLHIAEEAQDIPMRDVTPPSPPSPPPPSPPSPSVAEPELPKHLDRRDAQEPAEEEPQGDMLEGQAASEDVEADEIAYDLAEEMVERLDMGKTVKAVRNNWETVYRERVEAQPDEQDRKDLEAIKDAFIRRAEGETTPEECAAEVSARIHELRSRAADMAEAAGA